jgi:hypothetical protein
MPGEGQSSGYWNMAVKVVGYDAELGLGLMKAVLWSKNVDEVKQGILDAKDKDLILYPKQLDREPDPKEEYHVEKGLDEELDRQVEGHRVSRPRSLEDAESSLQERAPEHQVENEPEPRQDIDVDMDELAEFQRRVDRGPKL